MEPESPTPAEEPKSFAAAQEARAQPSDGLSVLRDDHRCVERLVREYDAATDAIDKVALSERLCLLLTVHAQIEEEIFYPALRSAGFPSDTLDEAVVEHITVRQLVADVESASPEDALLDAKVRVLGEYVLRHAQDEEATLFPAAAEQIDLDQLGMRLSSRRAQLCREAAGQLKARLRSSGPAAQMTAEHPTYGTRSMPSPFRAAAAVADLALTVLPGGGRLRRILRPDRRDDRPMPGYPR